MLRLLACCWILGIACIGQMHTELAYLKSSLWLWIAASTLLIYLILWRTDHLTQSLIFKWLLTIVLGLSTFVCGWQFSEYQLSKRLNIEVKQRQTVEGMIYIDQISEGKVENWRQTAQLLIPKQNKTIQILLYPKRTYDAAGELSGFTTDQFELGNFYQVTLDIKPAHSYANQGSFDQEKWLLQENIQGTATVLFSQPISTEKITALGWSQFVIDQMSVLKRWQLAIEKLRLSYRQQLLSSDNQQSKALLLGLLTGDRSGISNDTTVLYQQMGISHLLAISGPHVLILATMLTTLMMWILHHLMRRGKWEKLYLYLPKQRIYLPIFLVCVSFYVAFTGFEIPALRTWWMVFLVSICLWMRWQISTLTLLLCVASLVLFFDCFSILSAAFWLSFGASAILLMIYQQIQQQEVEGYQSWWEQFKTLLGFLWQSQWRIFIALLPIVLWQFQAVSLIAPLVNLLAIPLLSVVIVPLDILAALLWQIIPFLGTAVWWMTANFLSVFNAFLGLVQPIAELLYLPSALSPLMLLSLSIALLIISIPQGLVHRFWAVLFVLPCVLPLPQAMLQVDVLDVGQGQAVVLRTAKHQMLIDAGMGAWQSDQPTMGDRVVVPFLRAQGIKKLDEMLLTHLDLDHRGGADAVLKQLKVKQVRSNEYDSEKLHLGKVPFVRCEREQQWQWDQAKISILWPLSTDLRQDANESSCVVLVEVPMQGQIFKVLLMGDAGWEAEYHLLQMYPDLQADVLVLGHHGSRHSSAYDFLKRIRPKLAISSSGIDNRYGHPTPETLARLADLGIPHVDTTQAGQVHVWLAHSDTHWQWSVYRQSKRWLQPE